MSMPNRSNTEGQLTLSDITISTLSNCDEEAVSFFNGEFASLDEASRAASACTRCALCQTRTNVVFADGNIKAKLMIIGEGPGEREDATGLPFVGRAGQLLDKILASVNIDRKSDTYICNIVKCRPPQNRVPAPDEAAACRPYLEAQIDFVKPKLILLAGSTAVQYLLQLKQPISKIRGKWFEYRGSKVMPVFHPSYLLRNESKEVGSPKWFMWQDIKLVKATLDSIS
jgi:uracil-DNA glycosylase